ncbi:GNAT family N-acetyltransferase [Haloglycomyces albus]|uniref:GNAT family N-acetyltransferase n=1 Tax=Haloglycomyces albus TaxID=526067 RepID=UPI00046D14B5|nr:GNAT family protein [Haloglycomyces albus]
MFTLRRWSREDRDAVIDAFADPLMTSQFQRRGTIEESATHWLATAHSRYSRRDGGYFFCVVDRDDTVLGNVACVPVDDHSCGWVSYWTVPAARSRGVAGAALAAVVPWLHDRAAIERLELGHRVNNPTSGSVARKAGFAFEGRQRGKLSYGGQRYDVDLYGRLGTDERAGVPVTVALDDRLMPSAERS